eukprot:gene23968-biopygen2873
MRRRRHRLWDSDLAKTARRDREGAELCAE